MTQDKDERKRPNLRLVVSNPDKRQNRKDAEEEYLPLEELVAQREELRPDFYRDMERGPAKVYALIERFLLRKEWQHGLDPLHGKLLVLPAGVVCPYHDEYGGENKDEALLFVAEDALGALCLALEMVLPFYSDDDTVMEDAFLYAPVHQYGTLFLEENRQDGLLDFIYRLSIPAYPPALTGRLLERFFAIAAFELAETLRSLGEYPGG
jgi:hypothetical protein